MSRRVDELREILSLRDREVAEKEMIAAVEAHLKSINCILIQVSVSGGYQILDQNGQRVGAECYNAAELAAATGINRRPTLKSR